MQNPVQEATGQPVCNLHRLVRNAVAGHECDVLVDKSVSQTWERKKNNDS